MRSTSADDHIRSDSTNGNLDGFFAELGQGINAYLERLSRQDVIARYDAMSDEELAARGLRRDEIVKHVFRDRFFL